MSGTRLLSNGEKVAAGEEFGDRTLIDETHRRDRRGTTEQ